MIFIDERTSENDFNNINLDEIRNIVENALLEYDQKYGDIYCRSVQVNCVVIFLDKKKDETKIIIFDSYNIIGRVNKIMQSS